MALKIQSAKLAALAVTAVALCLTALYWHNEEQEAQALRHSTFEGVADQVHTSLDGKLRSYALILHGVRGAQQSQASISRAGFQAYYQSIAQEVLASGLQGVALAAYVPHAALAQHQATHRRQTAAGYQVRPPGERPFYAPITHIEPFAGRNLQVPGFDIASNPVAIRALEQARDTGEPALTGKLQLVQDSGAGATALVMYVPIYQNGMPLDTQVQRQRALAGWVSGPFRLIDMMASLQRQLPTDVGLTLHEGDAASPATLLFSSHQQTGAPATGQLQASRHLDLGDKHWTVQVHALPSFSARFNDDRNHWLVGVTGVALSLLLGAITLLLATGRDRALALARDMTHELRAVQADLEATLDAMPDVLAELDLDGRYYKYRTQRAEHLSAPAPQVLGQRMADVLPEDAARICMEALQDANANGFSFGRQVTFPINGSWHWFELSVARKKMAAQGAPRFIMVSRDVTERKTTHQQLQLNAQVFNLARDGIVITDASNTIISVNQSFTTITGYSASEAIGQSPRMLKSDRQEPAFYATMWQALQTQGYWQGEVWNRRKNGEVYPEWLSISAARDSQGRITEHIGILSDLTESKAAQARIDYLDRYDKLTRLPNQEILHDRTTLALASAKRTGKQVAMLFVDIDKFQNVNDSLGRAVGDQVIKTVADRLGSRLQADDTVSRQGGDEFIVLCPETDANGAAHVADRILRTIKELVTLPDGQELRLTASIGIAIYPENGHDFDRLIQCAGAALLHSKQGGRDGFAFFNEHMQGRAHEVLLIENQLRQAIAKDEFLLHFQPQVDAASQRIIGAEALIRWNHAEWGLVPPARFIPIAENSGQIMEIGDWVLRSALRQVAQWQQEGLPVVPVAVNLSAMQFHQAGLCDSIRAALDASQVAPGLIELELTESVAMENSGFTVDQISKLHDIGLTLSIDDFGTGYSSLSYLTRYKIDKLKIDQSFVSELKSADDDSAIVCAIINMAHGLGFKTIAEGVETQVQLDYLRTHGCDEIQGYFFSRPVPAAAFATLLRTGGRMAPAHTAASA